MREKILAKIKQALGTTQLSDRTINEVAVTFLAGTITSDELLTDEAIAPEVARLKVLEGQLNHEITEKLKSKVPPPKKTDPEPTPFDMDAFFEKFAKNQKESIEAALKPLNDKIAILESEKNLSNRKALLDVKKGELKLTKSWSVDFDNSVEYASLLLGDSATADQVYEKAYEHFNKTLTSRGETYKPLSGSDGKDTPDFSAVKALLDKEKENNK